MERQQTAQAYDCSVNETKNKAHLSNLRGLDARAFTKKTGAGDVLALNSS